MIFEPARVRAVIFDVDGTLADTDDAWVERCMLLLQRMRLRNPAAISRRIVMNIASPGNAMLAMLDRVGLDALVVRGADRLHRWRWRETSKTFRVVPGVHDMLAELHPHLPLAVCSARNDATVQAFIQYSDMQDVFVCVAHALTCKRTKPLPAPLLWCAQQLGVPADACLMVGDTAVDMRAGRAAGMQCVGVLCGFGSEEELRRAGAHALIRSTGSLASVLLAQKR